MSWPKAIDQCYNLVINFNSGLKVNKTTNRFSPALLGLVIIVIGLFLLISLFFKGLNADVLAAKYWPLLIFIIGAIMTAGSPKAGLITMFFGGLLLMYQMNLLDTGAGRSVTVFLIILLGLVALVSSLGPKSKKNNDLPPPRNE